MTCVNVAGAKGLWAALRQASSSDSDVYLVQESGLTDAEEVAFRRYAYKKGFNFHNAKGYQNNGRAYRGAAVLASRRLRTRLIGKWKSCSAQAVAVLVEGALCISLYNAGGDDAGDVHQGLAELISEQLPRVPWLIAGDHNELPHENAL